MSKVLRSEIPASTNTLTSSADYGHFEREQEAEIGHLFTCLSHLADDWQIERREQESRLVEDESGPPEVYSLSRLRDHGQTRTPLRSEPWGQSAG